MKMWVTEIKAIDPLTNELKTRCGAEVPGVTAKDAELYCQTHGLGYCKVIGELIAEIPCVNGEPDFEFTVDYEQPSMN